MNSRSATQIGLCNSVETGRSRWRPLDVFDVDDRNRDLNINQVYLNWFSDGQQFQLNAGLPKGTAVADQRSVFKVEDGLLKLVTGVWPADFPTPP
jgi:hypothetical protein